MLAHRLPALALSLALAAAAAASPIEPEDVAAAQAAAASAETPERLEPLVHMIDDDRTFEQFIQLHKPSLGKVLFFSKLGTSELCESLAERFDGQLDFLHVPPSAADVAAKFQIDELPAVFVLPSQTLGQPGDGTTLQLVKYDGNFKFGALDRIAEFLDEFAPPVPELPVISSQAEFADRCSGALPCLILLLQGDGEVHSPGLVPKLAKLLAGDRILGAIVDVGKWRAPLIQLQAQAPSAMFVGPFGSEGSYIANRMPDLAPNKEFTAYVVEYFLYESRRLASIAVEKGVVEKGSGLTELPHMPDIGGKQAPGRKQRKGRKARRQAKLEAAEGGAGAAASGGQDAGGDDIGDVEGESWLEL